MRTLRQRRRRLAQAAAMLCLVCAAGAGCEAPGRPRLPPLVSPDGTYVIQLRGHVNRAIVFEHPLRAEVYKDGTLYVPARQIFLADLFETPFQARYGGPEWPHANVVRFPARRVGGAGEPDALIVRNTGTQALRLVRIETGTDLFLVVDFKGGAELPLALTPERRPGWLNWLDVVIETGDPAAPLRGNAAFGVRGERSGPWRFTMAVSPHGVEFAETTGQGELYR